MWTVVEEHGFLSVKELGNNVSQGLDSQILAGGSLYCCTAVRLKTKVFSFSLLVLIQATC